ncbi:MAG: DUF488 family protein [Pyrobaculum sp.]
MRVYTVGYSAFTLSQLVERLAEAGVEVVVDVRRYPRSKIGFSKEALEEALRAADMQYVWMGELGALGVRGPRAGCVDSPTFDAYVWRLYRYAPAVMQLEELARTAARRTTAVLCREEDWRHCHRQFIADYLASRGFEVVHIRRRGVERHAPTPCYGKLEPPPLDVVEKAVRDFAHLCNRGSVYLYGGALHKSGGDIDVVVYGQGEPEELPRGYDAQFIPKPSDDLFHLFVTRGVLICGKPHAVDPRKAIQNELREADALLHYFNRGDHPVLVCKAAKRLIFLAAVLICGPAADTWHRATACLRGRGLEAPPQFKNCLSPPPVEEMRQLAPAVEQIYAAVRQASAGASTQS